MVLKRIASATDILLEPKPESVRRFYFLDYFYVVLKSAQMSSKPERIFDSFLRLKQEYRLGESKYKKLAANNAPSHNRMARYRYTFEQVLSEMADYQLIMTKDGEISLTEPGLGLLNKYELEGPVAFNQALFPLMEGKYHAFRHLLETSYQANPDKQGLLIFPIYSANRLGIERATLKTSSDLRSYFDKLRERLEADIAKHLGKHRSLSQKSDELITSLIDAGLLPTRANDTFDQGKYNVILKRGRDFWLKYFLQDLYNYQLSLTTFEIWAYRGKQIGVLHITESYPDANFTGRLVYPLSVIRSSSKSPNFVKLFSYQDKMHLYVHQPYWENEDTQEEFLQALHQAYLDVRQSARTYYVNLLSVKERVCYNMKIAGHTFDEFLSQAYHQRLRIKISLEVDKLPEETRLMYLVREPVKVDDRYYNIIAIDLA